MLTNSLTCCLGPGLELSRAVLLHRLKGERGDKIKRGWVGLGVLVALAVFAYGYEHGCQMVEILAINDEGKHTPMKRVANSISPCASCSGAGTQCSPTKQQEL